MARGRSLLSSRSHHGVLCFSSLVSAAQPRSAKNTVPATVKPAKEFRRPADCGMPGDGVSFQENAGDKRRALARSGRSTRHRGGCLGDEVRHGVPIDVLPRQAAESNALLFSLDQPLAGYMVKSMRLIPTNKVRSETR